jgi:hypothetical protein
MGLTKFQRNQLSSVISSWLIERIFAEAQDIVYEGITLKGLNDYTDQELLDEYAYFQGFDMDNAIAAEDSLYQQCIAELAVDEVISK